MTDAAKKLGQELRDCRETKGIELADLSSRTKISTAYLKKIESGEFDFLSETYVRAFLRTYAKEVGLAPNVIADKFKQISGVEEISKPKPEVVGPDVDQRSAAEELEKSERRRVDVDWLKKALTVKVAMFAGLTVILIAGVLIITAAVNKHETLSETQVIEIPLEAGIADADSSEAATDATLSAANPELLHLTITATETTWLRINFSNGDADERLFTPGDVVSWDGNEKFVLQLGNAGGVIVSLNGRALGAPGTTGQVLQVVVTKDGFTRQPYRPYTAVADSNKN